MSSDLVRRLRERPSRLAGESNDQRALRRQAEREAAAAHIEALEGEVATEKGTADRALMARDKAIARAERLEGEIKQLNQSLAIITDKRWDANARAERLREALQVMLEPQGHVEMARAQARKALEDDKQ